MLLINRLKDTFVKKDRSDISDLTLIIKTFERPRVVRRLVASIFRHYPTANIIVVDDSQSPQKLEGVTTITMPYDSGTSAGRNAAIEKVDTNYILLLDDDYVFSRRQKLGLLIEQMNKYPNIDILGGRVIDLPFYILHDFHLKPVHSSAEPKIPIGTLLGDNLVAHKVQNYFIARTEALREVPWNNALKTYEHTEFFNRALGKITTAFRDDMLILHARTPFNIKYLSKRFRPLGK